MESMASLVGQKFGQLTVITEDGKIGKGNFIAYICLCDCGKAIRTRGSSLSSGHTKSCGCNNPRRTTHNQSRTNDYRIWVGMHARCNSGPDSDYYKNYASRGITVCDRWKIFENFIADMGPRPSSKHSIDRINNDGNYEPKNCRWATVKQQRSNTRLNHYLCFKEQKMTIREWSEDTKLPYGIILWRIKKGWSAERTLTTPIHHKAKP